MIQWKDRLFMTALKTVKFYRLLMALSRKDRFFIGASSAVLSIISWQVNMRLGESRQTIKKKRSCCKLWLITLMIENILHSLNVIFFFFFFIKCYTQLRTRNCKCRRCRDLRTVSRTYVNHCVYSQEACNYRRVSSLTSFFFSMIALEISLYLKC